MSQNTSELLLIEKFGQTLGRAAYDLDRAYADPSDIILVDTTREALMKAVDTALDSGDVELAEKADQVLVWLSEVAMNSLRIQSVQFYNIMRSRYHQ